MRGNDKNTGCNLHSLELKGDSNVKYFKTDGAIFSTPIIDEDENIFIGSADKKFYAIDAFKNKIKWQFETKGVIDSAACFDESGNLYVPSGDSSLYKLSSAGEKIWEFNLLDKKFPRISTIYWWEGNIVIGPNGLIFAGNDDFYLYALGQDGKVRFTFPTGLQIWSAPAFSNGLVYFTSFDMCAYALNQDTGKIKWKKRLHNFIASSPAIDKNGSVYIAGFDGSVYSLDSNSGEIKWRIKTKKSIYASVAISPDGKILIGSGDGFVYCIDCATGAIEWVYDTGSAIWSSMVIGSDPEKKGQYLAYVGTSAGLIIALDPSGARRWAYGIKTGINGRRAGINASLALGKSGLAAATTDGNVIYIPYDAYMKNPDEFGLPEEKVSTKTDFKRPEFKFEQGSTFSIEKMEFITPEIINPFDQVGVASLKIDVKIIRIDSLTNKFTAYGIQNVGTENEGIPNPRRHFYLFNGTKKENTITLEAKNCVFDITAFPIPLDYLSFEFNVNPEIYGDNHFRAILNCKNLHFKIIKKYGISILKYFLKSAFANIVKRDVQFSSSIKTFFTVFLILKGQVWKDWGLINENGYLDAKGIFSIK